MRRRLAAAVAVAALAAPAIPATTDIATPPARAQLAPVPLPALPSLDGYTINGMPVPVFLAGIAMTTLVSLLQNPAVLQQLTAGSSGGGSGSLDFGAGDARRGSLGTGSAGTADSSPTPTPTPTPTPNPGPAPEPDDDVQLPPLDPRLDAIARHKLDEINAQRRSAGVPEVQWDEAKYAEALAWSGHLAANNTFAHNTSGFYYNNMGENIEAHGDPNAMLYRMFAEKDRVGGDRSHWLSLTDARHRYAAVGITPHPRWGYVVTVLLGSRPGKAPY